MELIINHTHCPVAPIGWIAATSMWITIAIHILISAAVSPKRLPISFFKREMDSIINKNYHLSKNDESRFYFLSILATSYCILYGI